MDSKSKDSYFVAVKVFLRDGDKFLITHDIFGAWDLPGGRIKKDEFETELTAVIARKIGEELGDEVRYELGDSNGVFFRVERAEAGLGGQLVRIFAVGFDAKYLGGEIKLGDHHDQMEWVSVLGFEPEKYFTGGWLKGMQDYLKIERAK